MPLVLSPLEGRKDGGGYLLVDPKNESHLDEHCRQAALTLRGWLSRYSEAVRHVGGDWRITFRIDQTEIEIIDLDYEDYH